MADPQKVTIEFPDRNAILQILQQAGIEFKEQTRESVNSISRLRESAIDMMRTLTGMVVSRMSVSINALGMNPTLNASFQNLAGQLGASFAASFAKGDTWKKVLGIVGEVASRAIVKVASAEFEELRMIGARLAPAYTAGNVQGTEDFEEIGRTILRVVNESRAQFGFVETDMISLMERLSQLGFSFEGGSMKIAAYALSVDNLFNLTRGTTEELIRMAVTERGQEWEDVAQIIEGVSDQTAYWAREAHGLTSGMRTFLSSNAQIIGLSQQVMKSTHDTAFELNTIQDVMFSMSEVFRKIGIMRPDMIATYTSSILSAVAPKFTTGLEGYTQAMFLRQLLSLTPEGEHFWKKVTDLMQARQMPAILTGVAVTEVLSKEPEAGKLFYTGILGGIAESTKQTAGDPTGLILRLVKVLNMGISHASVLWEASKEYGRFRSEGLSPFEALERSKKLDRPQEGFTLQKEGDRGLSIEDILSVQKKVGQNTISAAEKMSLAAERMTILRGENFWPTMIEIVKQAEKGDLSEGFIQKLLNRVVPKAEASELPVELRAGQSSEAPLASMIDRPQLFSPAKEAQKAPPTEATIVPSGGEISVKVDSYAKNTAFGVELVNLTAKSIAQVETGFVKGSQYLALGKVINKGRWKGQRAIGKYQIMEGNVRAWTKQYLGREMSPEEFRRNPMAQEIVGQAKIAEYLNKYGSPLDVASMWHAGRPVRRLSGKERDLGTGIPTNEYLRRFTYHMERFQKKG